MTPRFFVQGARETGEAVVLEGSDAHKILSVLRLRTGDEIEVIDSSARRYRARLHCGGRAVNAELLERLGDSSAPAASITVAQGVPKGQKMDFVVEKLTELGVESIVPLQSERTIVSGVAASKVDRWRRLAKSAAQQSGRASIPGIAEPLGFKDLVGRLRDYDVVLMPWELAPKNDLRGTLPALLNGAERILVLIGPEGGFSHEEAESAAAAGAHPISLGPRILRTETAALVAVSIIWYAIGV